MNTHFITDAATKLVQWGRSLQKILFLSLADERIAPKRRLSVLLESGGVTIHFHSWFLSRIKEKGARHYACEEESWPTPECLAASVALAMSDFKAAGAQVTLVVPKAWVIVKTVEFPLTVRENLSDVVSFELDRLTPLTPPGAFYDFRIIDEDNNRLRILLAVMRADTLLPYLEGLREKGLAVNRVVVASPPAGTPGTDPDANDHALAGEMNLLAKGVHPSPKTPKVLTFVLLTVLVTLGLFWLVSPLQIQEKKIEAIDREIAARKEEIKKIEALKWNLEGVDKDIAAIHAFKMSRPLMLNLVRELTQVLPKNTWLSRVHCTETIVEIEGYAASPTAILPKLEASPYFKKVEFASPIVRDTRMQADRFVIKMEIEGLPEEKGKP
jgi:general secretion pathway protein L